MNKIFLTSVFLTIAVSGCNNGGSSSGKKVGATGGETQNLNVLQVDPEWRQLLNKPASELAQTEIEAAYWGLAVDQYNGTLALAPINSENIERFLALRYVNRWTWPYSLVKDAAGAEAFFPSSGNTTLLSTVDLDRTYRCGDLFTEIETGVDLGLGENQDQQVVKMFGALSKGRSVVNLIYDNCNFLIGESILVAKPILNSLLKDEGASADVNVILNGGEFFSDLSYDSGSDSVDTRLHMVGYFGFNYRPDDSFPSESKYQNIQHLWTGAYSYSSTDGTRYLRWQEKGYAENGNVEFDDSVLAINDVGSVTLQEVDNHLPGPSGLQSDEIASSFHMIGAKGASYSEYDHQCGLALLAMDSNGDGVDDLARYRRIRFSDVGDGIEYFSDFVPMSEVTHPPVFRGEMQLRVNADADLEVEFYGLFDPDTSVDQLVIEYRWEVGGLPIEGIVGNILPSIYFDSDGFNPTVDVAVHVTASDGNNVTSETVRF